MTGWSRALDLFEENLDRCRALIDHDIELGHQTWPPADMTTESIPVELRARAQRLLEVSAELEAALVERRAALPRPRAAQRRRPPSGYSTLSTEL